MSILKRIILGTTVLFSIFMVGVYLVFYTITPFIGLYFIMREDYLLGIIFILIWDLSLSYFIGKHHREN